MPRIAQIHATPLSVPLRDPFVIASGRIDATRAALVRVELEDGTVGLGEAAALPPVTREDQPDIVARVNAIAGELLNARINAPDDLAPLLASLKNAPVARAGIEMSLLDAIAKHRKLPLRSLLGGDLGTRTTRLETDITIPILPEETMVRLAIEWRARGFRIFKVKVGKNADHDLRAILAIARAVPEARFRIDANAGFDAKSAIRIAKDVERAGLVVECWEQPCAKGDLDAMAEVARALDPPVIADESVATLDDLERVIRHRAADGVNLKIAKSGGMLGAIAIGRRARDLAMPLMVGGMVETRVGMTAAAHVAAALGGAEFCDLDTAWLLAEDPFVGGYEEEGATLVLHGHGLGVRIRGEQRDGT